MTRPRHRPKHALDVSAVERALMRRLFLEGVRVVDIAKKLHRGESAVQRAVRGLPRPEPGWQQNTPRAAELRERNERIVEMRRAGSNVRQISIEFGITPQRVSQVLRLAPPRIARQTAVPVESTPKRRRLTREERLARNRLIRRLRQEGVAVRVLMLRFELSKRSVSRIADGKQ